MPRIPIDSPIEYLARQTFPDYRLLTAEDSTFSGRLQPTAERVKEFEVWWKTHSELPANDLASLVAAARETERVRLEQRDALKEAARPFHSKGALADFPYWSRMAHWTLDEAVALSFGRDPSQVKLKLVQPYTVAQFAEGFVSPFAVEYVRRHELARRAVQWKQLFDPVLPAIFLAWARRLEISVPPELCTEVEARGIVIADWPDLHRKALDVAKGWQAQSEAASLEAKALKSELAAAVAECAELRARVEAEPRLPVSPERWPWGSHETALLRHLAAAAEKLWGLYNPDDPSTAPTNQQVVEFLQGRDASQRTAEVMATLLRADSLPSGPRK
jgi:hypothetical protein